VESDRYFLSCQRYIELNPVRAGMVPDPESYIWSSHLHYRQGKPDDLVTPHATIQALGNDAAGRRRAYDGLFSQPLPQETIDQIRSASCSGWALGGRDFCAAIERQTGRRARPVTPGRPRKIGV
jgi:REP-associated tyrosine transposase